MDQHRQLLVDILNNGSWSEHARTSTRTRHVFGRKMVYDLSRGHPLITTRKVPWKNAIKEQLWMLSGSTDNTVLMGEKVPVWRLWDLTEQDVAAYGKDVDARGNPVFVGSCGPIYGSVWRNWPSSDGSGIDQIQYVMNSLRDNPTSRRILVSAWNPDLLPIEDKSPQENVLLGRQCLAPCHTLFQLNTVRLNPYERLLAVEQWCNREDAAYQVEYGVLSSCLQMLRDMEKKLRKAYPNFIKRLMLNRSDGYVPRRSDVTTWLGPSYLKAVDYTLNTMGGVPAYRLDLQLYARSQDVPLGTVFNQFAYATLLRMFADQAGMFPGYYHHTMGDAHIYEDQMPGVLEQIKRRPTPLPRLTLRRKPASIFDYNIDDFELTGYEPKDAINFPLTK